MFYLQDFFCFSLFLLATTFIPVAVHHTYKVNDSLISIQGKRSQIYPEEERRNNVQFEMSTYQNLSRS